MHPTIQRIRDLVLSLVALIVLAPVFIVIAIAIKLDSRGPVLFRQQREGQHGVLFTIYKFRSMYQHVPKFGLSPRDGSDSRVTPVGRFLRRASLDEIPQLLNVIEGSLSLVGPRALPPQERPLRLANMAKIDPERVSEHAAWMLDRLAVKPGITGLAQISGRSRLDAVSSAKYDLEYIAKQSMAFDIWIMWRTVGAVLAQRGSIEVRKARVLVLTYGGGHVSAVLPVIRQLRARGAEVMVLAATIASEALTKAAIPHKTFGHYANSEILNLGVKYVGDLHNPLSPISFAESVAYVGGNMRDLIERFGLVRAERLLQSFGRRVFCPVSWMKQVVELERPDVILTTNVPRSELALRLAARECGVPSVAIEDLFGKGNGLHLTGRLIVRKTEAREALAERGIPENLVDVEPDLCAFDIPSLYTGLEEYVGFRYAFHADRVAVMSQTVAENLKLRGIAGESIVVTGQPAFDNLAGLQPESRNDVRKRLGLPTRPKILAYLERHAAAVDEFRELVRSVKAMPNVQIAVKPHPGEPSAPHRHVAEAFGVTCTVLPGASVEDVISAADAVVIKGSTTGMTSILLDRPLVVLNLSGAPDYLPFVEAGVALGAYHPASIRNVLEEALEGGGMGPGFAERRQRFIHVDGHAAERVTELVTSLI